MNEEKNEESLTLDKKTIDVAANIIPASRYFKARFNHMQDQINGIKEDLKDFRGDVDKRFEQIIALIGRLSYKLDYRDEK